MHLRNVRQPTASDGAKALHLGVSRTHGFPALAGVRIQPAPIPYTCPAPQTCGNSDLRGGMLNIMFGVTFSQPVGLAGPAPDPRTGPPLYL